MLRLYRQEMFKLLRHRGTYFCLVLVILQNIGCAWLSDLYRQTTRTSDLWVANFASPWLITVIMIAATATTIASEVEFNTLKDLVTQAYSREQVLISKWLTMLTYSVVLYAVMLGTTFINKFMWPSNQFAVTASFPGTPSLIWQVWLASTAANFMTMWLLLSVVFLLAVKFKRGVTAASVGVVGYVILLGLSRMTTQAVDKWEFLKWNPLNLLNYPVQLIAIWLPKVTHLTNNQMFIGNLGYILVFLGLGLYFFGKREV